MSILKEGLIHLDIDKIVINKEQSRKLDDDTNTSEEIERLAASIRQVSLLQPIVVYLDEETDKYVVVIGQRRTLAYRCLRRDYPNEVDEDGDKWAKIPAVLLKKKMDRLELLVLSATENIIRVELTRTEKSQVCLALLQDLGDVAKIMRKTGWSRRTIEDHLAVYQCVPELVRLWETLQVHNVENLKRANNLAKDQNGVVNVEKALKFINQIESKNLSLTQQKALDKLMEDENNNLTPDEKINQAGQPETHTRLTTMLESGIYNQLNILAENEGKKTSEKAADIVSSYFSTVDTEEEPEEENLDLEL